MQKALLIAEKPDLMRKLESVYEKHRREIPYGITFVSQRGHLITLKQPKEIDPELAYGKCDWDSLPIEPEEYGGWKYRIIDEPKVGKFLTSKERYEEIKKELVSGEYDFVIHAGDADQEGELLVNLVLRYAGNKLPVKRFWTNDLTESHILAAFQNLKDDDRDPMLTNLLAAAYARQHSDWRFGVNVSTACGLKMNSGISCGRVKTPILAIVCKRENEIRNFMPKTVYGVKQVYTEKFDGILFKGKAELNNGEDEEDEKSGTVWFDSKQEAENICRGLSNEAHITEYISKRVETKAPKLYKLATIQIDAGKKGYNDKTTLTVIQKLYEHEYLSYPRTDCEYLSSDEDFDGILDALSGISEFKSFVSKIDERDIEKVRHSSKWINDKALEESGHSALRPTTNIPDYDELSKAERDIYEMVCRRFIAIFLPPVVQDKVVLVTENNGYSFKSMGKVLVDPGYSTIFGTVFTDQSIPNHEKGDILKVSDKSVTEKTSVCPKRYTSPELIGVCENPLKFLSDESLEGLKKLDKKLTIGTPATRTDIIRQLIEKDKYIEEVTEKKTTRLAPTPLGEAIIKNLDGLQICRVDMTSLWEEKLMAIRKGELTLDNIEKEMRKSVREMLREIKIRNMSPVGKEGTMMVAGKCPICGRDVIENEKGFYCSGFRDGCKVSVYKNAGGCEFTFDDFVKLANREQVTKDKGRKFYFDFEKGKMQEVSTPTNIPCPCCPNNLSETPVRYTCSCGFGLLKNVAGHTVTEAELKQLGEESVTELIEDFVSKTGKQFSAFLAIKDGKVEFKFNNAPAEETNIKCPCCKNKIKEDEKKFFCECGFKVWKTMAGKTITKKEIRELSEDGQTGEIDGFVSKKGNTFKSSLIVDKRKKEVKFNFSK